MGIRKATITLTLAAGVLSGATQHVAAGPMPTNIGAMKALASDGTTEVYWRGGWGWGLGALAAGAIIGGAIAGNPYGYYGYGYPGYGYGYAPAYYGYGYGSNYSYPGYYPGYRVYRPRYGYSYGYYRPHGFYHRHYRHHW